MSQPRLAYLRSHFTDIERLRQTYQKNTAQLKHGIFSNSMTLMNKVNCCVTLCADQALTTDTDDVTV
jgi:hypothetical protein